jgi:hypothetical protein
VVLAAEALPPDMPAGVLLTSAEELGLAGARAWVTASMRAWSRVRTMDPELPIAINCDGVDDAGTLVVMRARGGDALAAALVHAAEQEHAPIRIRRLLPGVLSDAVVFAAEGWQAATLSRGTLGTLLRIHTARDTRDRLTGQGIAEAARVIARAAMALAR